MDLSRFPRRRYITGTTPIEPLPSLSAALGGPSIFIKRDDVFGLGGGGNKVRKLEFLVADALASDADTLITSGAVQSNHCRLTVAAAAREGLACHLVIEERVAGSYDRMATGNNFLFHLLGVDGITVVSDLQKTPSTVASVAADLESVGRRPYVIPGGGSNAIGALGYVACYDEIIDESFRLGLPFSSIVCASGSGGTHAGLLAGSTVRRGPEVVGISVRHDRERQTESIRRLTDAVLSRGQSELRVDESSVIVDDRYVGDGYSLPTEQMVEAVQLVARLEGILLDPVYTGKAMAGLIGLARAGRWGPDENVVFVHTGGQPALYAYESVLDPGRALIS